MAVLQGSGDGNAGASGRNRLVPLVIGSALFIQVLDATVISTALPSMAKALGRDPLALNAAVTLYLLATAACLPLGGWMADWFGAKRVFLCAIAAFALSSLLCGLSQTFEQLIGARILQGAAGALMTPVGRLVLLRSTHRRDLVWAISYLSLPALLGPMLGPPVGGFIVTVASWRWIFFINLPLAVAAMVLIQRFTPSIPRERSTPFDWLGFLLCAIGLGCVIEGLANLDRGALTTEGEVALIGVGALALLLYVLHARRTAAPVLDLRLFAIPTFRTSVTGGALGRLINGANPFLLAMLLQVGFGMSAFRAGLLTLASAGGALVMKALAPPIIARCGFKPVLIVNAVLAAAAFGAAGVFRPDTEIAVVVGVLFLGGLFRALQFTAINGLAYADVAPSALSRASTLWSVAHQLTQSLGVALAAFLVGAIRTPGPSLAWTDVSPAFAIIAAISLTSLLAFVCLPRRAGRNLALAQEPDIQGEIG
ncbi:MAG TPA: MFS transporter [Caulobacteraceae bacterium]|nr:MFS transporter [Caulobacteraceae bacterium]